MSFNKCFLSRDRIFGLEIDQIKYLLRRDSFILDDWSYSFLKLLNRKIDEYQTSRSLKEFSGTLLFPSNVLINLLNDPTDFDCLLASDILNLSPNQSIDFYIDRLDYHIYGYK